LPCLITPLIFEAHHPLLVAQGRCFTSEIPVLRIRNDFHLHSIAQVAHTGHYAALARRGFTLSYLGVFFLPQSAETDPPFRYKKLNEPHPIPCTDSMTGEGF
jgi:hypothetical protein